MALLEVSNSFQSRLEKAQQKPLQDRVVTQPSPTTVPVRAPLSIIPEDEAVESEQIKTSMSFASLLRVRHKENETCLRVRHREFALFLSSLG